MTTPARRLTVSEISNNPVNGLQGELAAEEIERILRQQDVHLHLDTVSHTFGSPGDPPDQLFGRLNPDPSAMTPSFLAGLVTYLLRRRLLHQVTFITANPHYIRRMAIIAAAKMERIQIQTPKDQETA